MSPDRKKPDPRRVLAGRIGGLIAASRNDTREMTERARAAFLDRFDRQVDPDNLLDPAARRRRSAAAKKAYFTALALKSAAARAKKAGRKEDEAR